MEKVAFHGGTIVRENVKVGDFLLEEGTTVSSSVEIHTASQLVGKPYSGISASC